MFSVRKTGCLTQRVLFFAAVVTTTGTTITTATGTAFASCSNRRGLFILQCLAEVLQFLAGSEYDTRLLDVGCGKLVSRNNAFGTDSEAERAEVIDADDLTAC